MGEVASRSDDGEGKAGRGGAEPRFRSCFRWSCASARQCQTKCAASCPHLRPLSQSLTALSAPPKGKPLAKAESLSAAPDGSPCGSRAQRFQTGNLADCQGLSLWERWHRGAMTERASPLTRTHRVRLDRGFRKGEGRPGGGAAGLLSKPHKAYRYLLCKVLLNCDQNV